MRRALVLLALLGGASTGCGSAPAPSVRGPIDLQRAGNEYEEGQLRFRAAVDLQCRASALHAEAMSGSVLRVSGCGRMAYYRRLEHFARAWNGFDLWVLWSEVMSDERAATRASR